VISVVLPVLDGRPWLAHQLEALLGQRCDEDWEVVVADNGSSDGTVDDVIVFAARDPSVRLVDASGRRGASAARNIGAHAAKGEKLAFCDADDVVAPGWLAACAAALARAEVVSGVFDMTSLNGGEEAEPQPPATRQMGFLPAGLSSNLAVSRGAFEEAGGFDEGLHVGEDFDLCWRMQLAGCRFAVATGAVVAKREREQLGLVFRRAVQYGRSGPLLYRRYRAHGARRQLGDWIRSLGWLLTALLRLGDRGVRRSWVRAAGMRLGRLIGSVEQRAFFP
jgi:glycosyltransferase involved in cell wall biosynthesis